MTFSKKIENLWIEMQQAVLRLVEKYGIDPVNAFSNPIIHVNSTTCIVEFSGTAQEVVAALDDLTTRLIAYAR